jgi:hypothetical protein
MDRVSDILVSDEGGLGILNVSLPESGDLAVNTTGSFTVEARLPVDVAECDAVAAAFDSVCVGDLIEVNPPIDFRGLGWASISMGGTTVQLRRFLTNEEVPLKTIELSGMGTASLAFIPFGLSGPVHFVAGCNGECVFDIKESDPETLQQQVRMMLVEKTPPARARPARIDITEPTEFTVDAEGHAIMIAHFDGQAIVLGKVQELGPTGQVSLECRSAFRAAMREPPAANEDALEVKCSRASSVSTVVGELVPSVWERNSTMYWFLFGSLWSLFAVPPAARAVQTILNRWSNPP